MEETFTKKIINNELHLYNGKGQLIFKKWLDRGYSKVFDIMTYNKNSITSITNKGFKRNV